MGSGIYLGLEQKKMVYGKEKAVEKIQVMSGAKLKYIAFASMFIDHVNKAILYPNINGRTSLVISDLFDIIGRIAFPIFMFLLVEGYFKTKNRWKYLGIWWCLVSFQKYPLICSLQVHIILHIGIISCLL